jgi:hypothetical protein
MPYLFVKKSTQIDRPVHTVNVRVLTRWVHFHGENWLTNLQPIKIKSTTVDISDRYRILENTSKNRSI